MCSYPGKLTPPAAVSVYLDDVNKPQRGQAFQGDQFVKKPSVSQADKQQYFEFMSQTTKPHPGLTLQHLDHIMGKDETEAQGSSHGGSVNPYWPAVHMKFLAEDMDKVTEDLDKLATSIRKRKIIGHSASSYEGESQQKDTDKLAESARELQEAHQHLQQYIERQLGRWADQNDIRILDTFFDKNLSRKKKPPAGQEIELKADSQTIKDLFATTSSFEQVYEILSRDFRYLKHETDQDFWALQRSYIQAVDQAYKHNLIGHKDFKDLVQKRGYATAAARYMFLHFTHSENGYKNPLYRSSDILLELPYASHFVNMLNVIDREEKTRFLHEILRLDAVEYIKTNHEGLAENALHDSFKFLFGSGALLEALERGLRTSQVQKHLEGIIRIFMDQLVWETEWRESEAMRLMAQTLKFVDENFLDEEAPHLYIPGLIKAFDDPLRKKMEFFSARAQAIVELEKLSKYLQASFPLRTEGHPPKPISPLEELDLIERKLGNLPVQVAYQSKIASNLKGKPQTLCEDEIYGKINALRGQIDKHRKRQSGPSWLPPFFN
ncbi:hypothetical protein Pst134EA_013323 [Puccinia striiformis f. sp. tritici]|uniref:hypothetical protein n=1 Tax=Puccinia striiformis f. sp. tritici TaxID=168172 RepID=UPI002008732B|nr:hypothetical protein Pst134EA_013323 [Puccinia striiformis f. sp. tritici]KAH9465439.1 hypothetical protein Pst134EA_013323 [Puccinia striiformis f. sp. tritici]